MLLTSTLKPKYYKFGSSATAAATSRKSLYGLLYKKKKTKITE